MSEYYVQDFEQSDGGAEAKLIHNETGEELTLRSADYMSESDFLDEIFSMTEDPRFHPYSCSRMVMEKLSPVTDPTLNLLS